MSEILTCFCILAINTFVIEFVRSIMEKIWYK